MTSIVVNVLLWLGVALLLICSLGLLAMRSPYDRLHYVGGASWAVLPISIAILVRESWSLIGDKALLIAILLLVLSPVMGHATARAGRIRDRGAWNAHGREHSHARERGQGSG